jgi:membrane associated rhomboid family serine protease
MVGASGALFGLAGAILAWDYIDRFSVEERLWPVARAALLLVGLNIALYYAMGGILAWQAHLGGFVAGWISALLIDPIARA